MAMIIVNPTSDTKNPYDYGVNDPDWGSSFEIVKDNMGTIVPDVMLINGTYCNIWEYDDSKIYTGAYLYKAANGKYYSTKGNLYFQVSTGTETLNELFHPEFDKNKKVIIRYKNLYYLYYYSELTQSGKYVDNHTIQYEISNPSKAIENSPFTFKMGESSFDLYNVKFNSKEVFTFNKTKVTYNSLSELSEKVGTSLIQKAVDSYSKDNDIVDGQNILKYGGTHTIELGYDGAIDIGNFKISIYVYPYKITSLRLKSVARLTLGNKLDDLRESFNVEATFSNGDTIDNFQDYTFQNNDYILSPITSTTIKYKGLTYNFENLTWQNPSNPKVTIERNNTPQSYTNNVNAIDYKNVKLLVKYDNATYVQELSYSDTVSSKEYFTVTSSELSGYNFNGENNISIEMNYEAKRTLDVSLQGSYFFENTAFEKIDSINILEIIDILGITLSNVRKNYTVGDAFLSSEDNQTIVTILFKDGENNQKYIDLPLNSGLKSLNITPSINTKLNSIEKSINVLVSSSTNSNISASYTIEVSSSLVTTKSNTIRLVAVKVDSYKTKDNEILDNKYLLVNEEDTSYINGVRNTIKSIENVKVYGYLEDVGDKTKNARVILFEDYVPPVDGQSNITVKFPCYVKENADKINKCRFGILFGNNNAKNRLFLSGNPDYPNCDWHSGSISNEGMGNSSFAYFEDTSYCYYGETDNEVVGYDIISNNKLLVLKNKSDKETTVYFRTPTLVTAIDGGGNAVKDIDNNNLYQEEFSLVKGNNSIGGLNHQSIVNLNGDSLFLSDDNTLRGLDLVGIVGDNQRYANSRSYYIDKMLKKEDLSNAWVWSNNKYLFIVLKDKIYVTHYETKGSETNQYEWWVMNVENVTSIVEVNNVMYLGFNDGKFAKVSKEYRDIKCLFLNAGSCLLKANQKDGTLMFLNELIYQQLAQDRYNTIQIKGNDNLYYKVGTIGEDFVIKGNSIELTEDTLDNIKYKIECLTETTYIYFKGNKDIDNVKYRIIANEEYSDYGSFLITDEVGKEINDLSIFQDLKLCLRIEGEEEINDYDDTNSSFKIYKNGRPIELLGEENTSYKAVIRMYKNVEAFYITKPFDMGSPSYFKTVTSWTITNDTSIPSELDIAYVNNKIPMDIMKPMTRYNDDVMKKLQDISKQAMGFSFNNFNFYKMDFMKDTVPRSYTNHRVIGGLKFICFGFRNYNDTNSVLSALSIVYKIPKQSYGGE